MALDFERDGVTIREAVIGEDVLGTLAREFDEGDVRVGARSFVLSPTVKELLKPSGLLTQLAVRLSGVDIRPVRVLAFDKTPDANWHLPWHQDRVIAVKTRVDLAGFGTWTIKGGQPHVEAPAYLLEKMFNLRLHIDDCDGGNGALKVVPGTHGLGRLSDTEVKVEAARGLPWSVPSGLAASSP